MGVVLKVLVLSVVFYDFWYLQNDLWRKLKAEFAKLNLILCNTSNIFMSTSLQPMELFKSQIPNSISRKKKTVIIYIYII